MADPFVGEIRMFGGTYAPEGWAFCNGQVLGISDYETLYQLIGTTYGGDGQNTFGLPNLIGRLPLNVGTAASGTTYVLGQPGGTENVTLTAQQLPGHTHSFNATGGLATANTVSGNLVASVDQKNLYYATPNGAPMAPVSIGPPAGSGQPHANVMPFLAVSFIISLFGIYPSQN